MTPRFGDLFFRQVLRPWVRHPLLPALNILSIAVGVAVFLAIQMANRGALTSFQNAVGFVAGRAHLEVRGNLPDGIFPAVAGFPGVRAATPLVEGIVTLPDEPGEYLRILGVDPLTGQDLRAFELGAPDGSELDSSEWLRDSRAVAVTPARAKTKRLDVLAGGRLVALAPRFVLTTRDAAVESDPRIAAMDIGWAQELLDSVGRLTSIQILLDDPLQAVAVAEGLRSVVPADATVAPPARRGSDTEAMLAAFQLNLTALSLVSMVVGVFLIYNSLSAMVVRRRVEIGILRASGATRGEISGLFLGEGIACGLAGSALGIILAAPLARLLAAPVGQTVSSLYAVVSIRDLTVSPDQILLALLVGTLASLAAAWLPAREAAACDPARILHPGSASEQFSIRSRSWLAGGLGALAAAAAAAWIAYRGGGKFLGFASVALLIAGFSMLVPSVVRLAAAGARFPGWMVRLGIQQLVRSMHRSAVTIAALAVAAAMTVSVSVMIHSFRGSVSSWLEKALVADLFIAPAANEIIGLQSFVPQQAVAWARSHPGVRDAGTFREMMVPVAGSTAALGVVEGGARGDWEFVASVEGAAERFHEPGFVVVSESFANRFGARPGDVLHLAAPRGEVPFQVAGVIKDFTRDAGLIMVDRKNFTPYWDDARVHSLALRLHDPANAGNVAAEFRSRFGREGAFSIYTNSDLRRRVMEIFDQTFAVTSVLRAIAVVVAVAGVLLSLSTLVLEREREIGVLRSQGASPGQVRGLVFTEAACIGLLASVVGVACGSAMAMVLTWVINKAFFGWSIELSYPLDVLAATPLWIVPAAVAAAWLPARRASRIPPAQALRFE